MPTDYLGDVNTAFRRLEGVSPHKVEARIDNSDQHQHRYLVTLWNGFGRWEGSKPTLAECIHTALDKAQIDNYGLE